MKIKLRGNVVAIALSALAVAIAMTGTAVAVTATVVNIADPSVPARVAHVDPTGRLTTADFSATLNSSVGSSTGSGAIDIFVTSPTTATLGVTRINVSSLPTNGANYFVELLEVPVDTGGSCSTTSFDRILGIEIVRPGDNLQQQYGAPMIVKPVSAGRKYCIDVFVVRTSSTSGASDTFYAQLNGYVAVGPYTGLGTNASGKTPAAALHGKKLAQH